MRKITFMMGAAAGFLVGSRAGREPYEQVEGKVRQLLGREDVRQTVEEIKSTAKEQATSTAHTVADKMPGSSGTSESGSPPTGGQTAPTVPTPIE